MDEVLFMSAGELADKIRTQALTSVRVTQLHLEQMQRVNPMLNAIVVDRYAKARVQAQEADARITQAHRDGTVDQLPPLLGVPCTIKESFAVSGMPNTAGSIHRQHLIADKDAPAVSRIKDAGAIILGLSNTSELCMWMESFNPVYGLTNNAYSEEHTAGGSSGGEGAIVGSGASPFGLGSDIGGSIRMPAMFNGVFGHKGSPGLIPNTGQFPQPEGIAQEMLSTGPICRRASDLPLLIGILSGQSGKMHSASADRVASLRILRRRPDSMVKASRPQTEALEQATLLLQQAGARVEYHDWPEFGQAFDIWSNTLSSSGSTSFAEMMYGSREIRPALQALTRLGRQHAPHTLPLIMLSLLEHIPDLMPGRRERLLVMGQTLRQRIINALGDDGILLDLSYPTQAPRHYRSMLPPWGFPRSAIYNALRLPSTQVPMGVRSGLPTGIQIVASPQQDVLTVSAALFLEEHTGGWTPPWNVG